MPRPQWLRFWTDHSEPFRYNGLSSDERRRLVLESLNRSDFGWHIVFVAGFGFFADSYGIFSINVILPMISIVYWQNEFPTRYKLGVNLATLLGTMIGQVVLGYMADRVGRRKVYGLELALMITACLGFATASSGSFNSMSFIGLLVFWRLIMGIGIGGDYPLSAVITAEFAPTRHRDTMLAAVFFFQPLAQLVAILVAFAATAGLRSHIASIQATHGDTSCSIAAIDPMGIDCARTVDKAWRLVAGLGAVPAIIAIYFRFTIPESVYYSLDVTKDISRAATDSRFFPSSHTSGTDSRPSTHSADSQQSSVTNRSHNASLAQRQAELSTASESQGYMQILAVEQQGFIRRLRHYLSTDDNWKDLFSTSINWMLLDFNFYLLGVNSASFIPTLFGQKNDPDRRPYSLMIDEQRQIMQSSSVGALLGSLAAVAIFHCRSVFRLPRFINSPRKIQKWGFVALALLFVIVGALYMTLPTTRAHVAIVFFYQLCNLFFNLGPNTTTFVIPAQIFPTQFRCTCYGISAAFGKLGSALGQLVVTEVTSNQGLGGTLIGISAVMLAGALLTALLTPETCERESGLSLDLAALAERKTRIGYLAAVNGGTGDGEK